MKTITLKALVLSFAAAGGALGQDLTHVSPAQTRMVIIRNATVHSVAKGAVEGGAVAFAEGKVTGGGFMEAFLDKGRMRPVAEAVPVWVVTDEALGLRGAARAALSPSRQ